MVYCAQNQMNWLMKYLITLAVLLSALTFMACEGDRGPAGPPGLDGLDGVDGDDGLVGFVMEWEGVDFTASSQYKALLELSTFDFQALESDVALVYFLWAVDENTGDEIWRQIPQTLIIPEGILQYNYDFTRFDVELFMDADFDLGILGANDTDDWIVRVVVVPGEFVGGRKATSEISYKELEEKLELPQLKRRSTDNLLRREVPNSN